MADTVQQEDSNLRNLMQQRVQAFLAQRFGFDADSGKPSNDLALYQQTMLDLMDDNRFRDNILYGKDADGNPTGIYNNYIHKADHQIADFTAAGDDTNLRITAAHNFAKDMRAISIVAARIVTQLAIQKYPFGPNAYAAIVSVLTDKYVAMHSTGGLAAIGLNSADELTNVDALTRQVGLELNKLGDMMNPAANRPTLNLTEGMIRPAAAAPVVAEGELLDGEALDESADFTAKGTPAEYLDVVDRISDEDLGPPAREKSFGYYLPDLAIDNDSPDKRFVIIKNNKVTDHRVMLSSKSGAIYLTVVDKKGKVVDNHSWFHEQIPPIPVISRKTGKLEKVGERGIDIRADKKQDCFIIDGMIIDKGLCWYLPGLNPSPAQRAAMAARNTKTGWKGVLFADEIAAMPQSVEPKTPDTALVAAAKEYTGPQIFALGGDMRLGTLNEVVVNPNGDNKKNRLMKSDLHVTVKAFGDTMDVLIARREEGKDDVVVHSQTGLRALPIAQANAHEEEEGTMYTVRQRMVETTPGKWEKTDKPWFGLLTAARDKLLYNGRVLANPAHNETLSLYLPVAAVAPVPATPSRRARKVKTKKGKDKPIAGSREQHDRFFDDISAEAPIDLDAEAKRDLHADFLPDDLSPADAPVIQAGSEPAEVAVQASRGAPTVMSMIQGAGDDTPASVEEEDVNAIAEEPAAPEAPSAVDIKKAELLALCAEYAKADRHTQAGETMRRAIEDIIKENAKQAQRGNGGPDLKNIIKMRPSDNFSHGTPFKAWKPFEILFVTPTSDKDKAALVVAERERLIGLIVDGLAAAPSRPVLAKPPQHEKSREATL